MAQLTYDQVKQLWIDAGGSEQWAPLAAGLAYGESGWRTDAVNPNSPDYGLWQLTYAGNLNEDRTRKYGTPEQLMADPALQARAVVAEYGPRLEFVKTGFGGAPGRPETGDVIYQIWQGWSGGTYQAPGDAEVRRWTASTLSDPRGGGPGGTAPEATGDSSGNGGGTTAATAERYGCAAGNSGVDLPFGGKVGTKCQIKALAGGLLVAAGISLMVTGAILVATQTKVGKAAAGIASNAIPGGGIVRGLRGSGSQFPRVTAETEAESRANYDARNPSPARVEATRRARSGNLGTMSYTMDDLASDLFRFD